MSSSRTHTPKQYDTVRQSILSMEDGQSAAEYSLILTGLALVVFVGLGLLTSNPSLLDKAVVAVVAVALLGALDWSFKTTIANLSNTARLLILETLRTQGDCSQAELHRFLAKKNRSFRILPDIVTDTLASLVVAERMVKIVDGGKYRLAIIE